MNQALTDILKPLKVPASWLYGGVIARRNRQFDRGARVQKVQPSAPVISVGNITTGGVGKSPFVTWLAELLLASGHRPVIAMRGYMAKPGELSDEQAEYMERLSGVDVLAHPDRVKTLNAYLPDHEEIDCVLLDDGFQHRYVHRDLDLVLIDATRNTLRDVLLPVGRLREPLVNLHRADAVLVTHASGMDELIEAKIERFHGKPPLAWSDHKWSHLRLFESSPEERQVELRWLKEKRVVTMLGVGNPKPVQKQLEAAGACIMANIPAGDHERYDQAKLNVARGLCDGAQALVMTAKDWVKARELIDFSTWNVPIVVPHLVLDVYEGARELQELVLQTVEGHGTLDG
ncbi:MAG: tetraacyldisaccharide 4'-kinase [Planctomycetota bacterium]|nr:tetraacyldisaccharide 4'-kinase [Planctomycetota bacterium]